MKIATRLQAPIAVATPAILGWIVYDCAAWLVRHDSINYRLNDAGFGFLSNAAEMIFALGPFGSIGAGIVFGLPSTVVYLRRVGSVSTVATVNALAVLICLSCLGCVGILFAGALMCAPLFWIVAMIWAATHQSNQHMQPTPR